MKPVYKKRLIISSFVLALTALACGPLDLAREILGNLPTPTPTGSFELHESSIWYVATDGDDSNSCAYPEEACLTLKEAVSRADDDDQIYVAAGTYAETHIYENPGYSAMSINYDLIITGDGRDTTFIDGGNLYGVFNVQGDARVRIEDLTIQHANGNSPGSCVEVRGDANVILEDVNVHECMGGAIRSSSTGLVTMLDVNVTGTVPGESRADGFAISGTNFDVQGGQISDNYSIGINSYGALTMNGTLVQNNGGWGIGIGGTANLANVTVINNASGYVSGNYEGIQVLGNATIVDSNISNNEHGIIVREEGVLRLERSTVSGNPRIGIDTQDNADVTIVESTISDNGAFFADTSLSAGVGLDDESRVVLRKSEVSGNHNGGIQAYGLSEVLVIESTIIENEGSLPAFYIHETSSGLLERSLIANNDSGNSAVENSGSLVMLNTTVSGNTGSGVTGLGGGLAVSYSTITNNTDIGLVAGGGRDVFTNIANVIVASNGDRDCSFSIGSSSTSPPLSGNNIATDSSCGFPETYTPAELLLDALADNGGPTETHALQPGSPAIDTATGSCPATDQRNAPRPVGPACDVGAYEAGAVPLSLEDPDIVIGTPTPDQPGTVTITTTTPCYRGPGSQYGLVSNLASGVTIKLIGAGFTGNGNQDWVVASHPTAANTNCWLDTDDVTPSIPFDQMRLITIPGLPTPTPKPTSDRPPAESTPACYYNANNVLICP